MLVDRERELVSATSETAAISGKLSEIIEEKRDMENVIFQLQAEKRAIESEKMELEKTNDTLLNEVTHILFLIKLRCVFIILNCVSVG